MSVDTQTTDTSLKITKVFSAPVEKVYEAFSNADQIRQWMGPGEVKCEDVQADVQVGGQFRIHMISDEGDHVAVGTYKEVVPNEKLQYTWTWESGVIPVTLITVTFKSQGDKTEITFLHENFAAEGEAVQKHTQGWTGCLDNLEKFLG